MLTEGMPYKWTYLLTYRRTNRPSQLAEGWKQLDTVLHSSDELTEVLL